MNVALVHDFLLSFGGAERVLRHIADLFPGAAIYCLAANERVSAAFPGHEIRPSLNRFKQWQLLKLPTAIEQINLSGFDLVVSSSNSFAHGVITGSRTLHLCYCHSPTRYLWDYRIEYLAERLGPRYPNEVRKSFAYQLPVTQPMLHYLRLWDAGAADRPDHYLANSRTVADRIRKFYRIEADVVYPPAEIDRFRPSASKDEFYVMVTRLSEYKKVDLVIGVFNRLKRRLLIIGEGRDHRRLERLIRSPQIELLGWQSDEAVAELLGRARALIHPQLEDFGLTVVEALASGTPVIALRAGGATEIMDERHGVFFDSQHELALQRAIAEFERRRFDRRVLIRQAHQFSADRFNQEFMNTISGLKID